MKIITGATGQPHITPQQDAMWHRGIGADNGVFDSGDKFEHQIISNNLIRLSSGICAIQGRFASIDIGDTEDAIIENGSQGVTRYDIICAKISVTDAGYSNASIITLKGTDGEEPAIPQSVLDNGDTEAYLPLYKVTIESLAITNVEKLFNLIGGNDLISDEWDYSKQYQLGDYAIYGGSLWKALVSSIGVEPKEDISEWKRVRVADEFVPNQIINITDKVKVATTKGTYYSHSAYACGGMVQLMIAVETKSSTSAGQDLYTGVISGEYTFNGKRYSVRPVSKVQGTSYASNLINSIELQNTGGIVFRALIGTYPSGLKPSTGMTYLAQPLD